MHIYMPKMTLPSLLKQISFLYKKVANIWYMTCFVSNFNKGCYGNGKKNAISVISTIVKRKKYFIKNMNELPLIKLELTASVLG